MKDNRLYLLHILECIERIEQYTVPGQTTFLAETMVQDAVLHNLQILSESTQRLSPKLKDIYPEVSWSQISAFRNVLVHDYLGINLEQIWSVVKQDLPILREQIQTILADTAHQV